MTTTAPELFNRRARRMRRDRAAANFRDHDFLRAAMIDGILDRLGSVTRSFDEILDLGCFDGSLAIPGARIARADPGFRFARGSGGVQVDEDALPFADASFDCVISAGVLDQVSDLPGALTLIRRILRPDGLFLGAFVGAGSLATLRQTLRAAEGDRPAARLHPQVDVRAAGDLLVRAGFTLPVADLEAVDVRYGTILRLLQDLRGMAATNLLLSPTVPLSRPTLAAANDAFSRDGDATGRVAESFQIIFLTGWAPAPGQPKPAARGSATASLTDALRTRR